MAPVSGTYVMDRRCQILMFFVLQVVLGLTLLVLLLMLIVNDEVAVMLMSLTEKRWSSLKELSDTCGRSLAEMVDDLKGFDAANAQITAWLGQKEKMISFLGPLAAEPVMIRNQIQQLEVSTDVSLLIDLYVVGYVISYVLDRFLLYCAVMFPVALQFF